jgi:hypothetical protein
LRNVVKRGKYSLANFVNFVYVCIIFGSKMVTISARNIQTYTKYANLARLYFPYFTTFRNQILLILISSLREFTKKIFLDQKLV